jgi:hypothetical protein
LTDCSFGHGKVSSPNGNISQSHALIASRRCPLDRVLPRRRLRLPELPGGSVPCSMPLGLRFGRPRPTLEPRNLIAQGRHHSLKLDDLFPLLDNQALQLGGRQAIKIAGRRHAHKESDSRRLGNLIIIPMPRVLSLSPDNARSGSDCKRPATNTNGPSVKPGKSLRCASNSVFIWESQMKLARWWLI